MKSSLPDTLPEGQQQEMVPSYLQKRMNKHRPLFEYGVKHFPNLIQLQ